MKDLSILSLIPFSIQLAAAKVMLMLPILDFSWKLLEMTSAARGAEEDLLTMMNIQKGDTILEAGSRTGGLTVALATKVGIGGKVIAVEPNPYAFHMLCHVIRNLSTCVKVNAALGEKVGYTSFFLKKPFDNGAHIDQSTTNDTLRVRMTTVDALSATLNIDHIDYFIIDCEGAELNILKGSEKILKKRGILNLLVEIHNSQLIKQIEKFLSSLDYEIILRQSGGYPIMIACLGHSRFPKTLS